TTVVSTPLPGRATVDAGSKTLSTDRAHLRDGYGIVAGRPDAEVVALYEEHGLVMVRGDALQVGDRIEIIPNHSCILPNLSGVLYGVRDGRLEAVIPVEARGCNT
ncbi:MAG: amino acid processing protein, partial [Alicyclobacillus sp.]|nr:amino acid processing protein [Alicyclobacillus sp.]